MINFTSHNHPTASSKKENILQKVQGKLAQKDYAFFDVLNDDTLLSEIEKYAFELKKNFRNFVVLGTGGSSLGAKTLCDLTNNPFVTQEHNVHFLNNVDSHTIEQLLSGLDLSETCFIAVSKSGSTAETLCQTLCIIKDLEARSLEVKKHFVILTEDKDSPLTQVAETYFMTPLTHHKTIGGRFSVFSNVGFLPAALRGLDLRKLQNAAKDYLAGFATADTSHAAFEGALMAVQGMSSGQSISVMMPYVDRLTSFAQWYAQLWAESLGKSGKGSTPVAALGTVDQHSQLQLYSDGPDDKLYTFLVENSTAKGLVPSEYVSTHETLRYLDGQTMGDLLFAEANATIDSLKNVGRPVRVISFETLDEEVLGQLLAHFMLETILTAELLELNAFDQPGVEQSKRLTRQYLAQKKVP